MHLESLIEQTQNLIDSYEKMDNSHPMFQEVFKYKKELEEYKLENSENNIKIDELKLQLKSEEEIVQIISPVMSDLNSINKIDKAKMTMLCKNYIETKQKNIQEILKGNENKICLLQV